MNEIYTKNVCCERLLNAFHDPKSLGKKKTDQNFSKDKGDTGLVSKT